MPKKEVWLSEETLDSIRKILGIKQGDKDTGISEWIRDAVSIRQSFESMLPLFEEGAITADELIESMRR